MRDHGLPPRASADNERTAAELDAVHVRAREAYARGDATSYIATFHPALRYTQRDGQTIGRALLARDIRAQLARVNRAATEYRREALELIGDKRASEVLAQRAMFEAQAFGILRRVWTVERRGRYEWERTAAGWQIRSVDVLFEEVRSRTWLGFG